ncbi:MAG TPA: hypothetical protein VIL84_16055 [Devosiaceae bacterium]
MPSFVELLMQPIVAFGWFSTVVVILYSGLIAYRGIKTGDWHFMDD